jgi:very-short-patch-repair endonuclease
MKKTTQQMIDKLNSKLSDYNQIVRVMVYSTNSIELSTGHILTGNSKSKFCKRILSEKTTLWVENIDELISGGMDEKIIKSKLASIGGKSVQKIYGNAIKQNLNTGTSWNAGTKGQNIGTGTTRSQAVKDKISKKNSGSNNGMYGVKMSPSDKEFRSLLMREKILEGTFTPNSNNRNTHWNATLDGTKYRSSWEALYQFINEFAEYEKLRIQYELNSKNHVYIVDFVDNHNKLVIEVKPKELCSGEKFTAKIYSLREWAKNNGYDVLLVDKEWLRDQIIDIDYTRFDDKTAIKIKALYETT